MSTQLFTTPVGWDASGRITAAADTDILITNTSERDVFFAITAGDVLPVFGTHLGHKIKPGDNHSMTLRTGLRLWIACRAQASEITITQDAG